jgi:hypothetical protein
MTRDPFALRELLGPDAVFCRRAITGEHGVALPPFTDHHVHLHLIDDSLLAAGGVAAVLDLGGDPLALAQRDPHGIPRVAYAGAFLTAPGGYPAGRPWAPDAVVREITDASRHPGVPGGAATAVDEQAAFGASVIKIALNSTTGPVPDAETLAAVIATAHERGLAVVAHAEGEGMPRLAAEAGVDAFAHTPFDGVVDRDLIVRAVATGQVWISTLAIHGGDRQATQAARVNLAAFAAAGGRVLYGTDLGNGERPVGIVAEEVAELDRAGVRGPALIATMTDPWPAAAPPSGVSTFVGGEPPAHLDEVAAWLRGATVVPTEELIHDEC